MHLSPPGLPTKSFKRDEMVASTSVQVSIHEADAYLLPLHSHLTPSPERRKTSVSATSKTIASRYFGRCVTKQPARREDDLVELHVPVRGQTAADQQAVAGGILQGQNYVVPDGVRAMFFPLLADSAALPSVCSRT